MASLWQHKFLHQTPKEKNLTKKQKISQSLKCLHFLWFILTNTDEKFTCNGPILNSRSRHLVASTIKSKVSCFFSSFNLSQIFHPISHSLVLSIFLVLSVVSFLLSFSVRSFTLSLTLCFSVFFYLLPCLSLFVFSLFFILPCLSLCVSLFFFLSVSQVRCTDLGFMLKLSGSLRPMRATQKRKKQNSRIGFPVLWNQVIIQQNKLNQCNFLGNDAKCDNCCDKYDSVHSRT